MSILGSFIVPHPPLIIPEVGKGEQLKIQKTIDAYHEIAKEIARLKPDTIILSTPHSVIYSDYFHISPGTSAHGDLGSFGAHSVQFSVNYDTFLIDLIMKYTHKEGISAGIEGEKNKALDHATMVPLYFINQYLTDYKLVRLSLSGFSFIDHYHYGKCIEKAIHESNERVVWVASGDLSHKLKVDGPYGLAKEGPIFDKEITEAMKEGNFLKFLNFEEDFCEKAAECGLRSFIMMAGALDGKEIKSRLLSYEGPFGVGYAVAAYPMIGENEKRHFGQIYDLNEKNKLSIIQNQEDDFTRLARQSLEYYVKNHRHLPYSTHQNEQLSESKAGVFVSIKKDGRLRGCIGTISPTKPSIAEEIIENAISSGARDYRFEPVQIEELPYLVYSVDVLKPAEPIKSIHELDVKRYGVIVRKGMKSGLLLPNLEGVDTPKEQVNIALRKAGISEKDTYTMERFEVIRHH